MHTHRILILALALTVIVGLSGDGAQAQSGGGYDLSWWTVDNGGNMAEGGGYALMGTIGQAEPGAILVGGGYTLYSGFWPAGSATGGGGGHKIYLPLVMRNS